MGTATLQQCRPLFSRVREMIDIAFRGRVTLRRGNFLV
jgi:hypothetical protein